MAKKTKRNAARTASGNKTVQATVQPVVPAESQPAATAMNGKGYGITGFNPDYTPVKKDLVRIAVLAGIFFAALVVLTFFLR